MSRLRLFSGEVDHNDLETSSVRSKAGSSVSGKSETVRLLSDRLRLESKSRQETDELYRRLQHEYDDLLARHAQAENTIDQLKIGAKIKLYSDDPKPMEVPQVRFVDVKSQPIQKINLARTGQAILSRDQLSDIQSSPNSARHYPVADSSVELDFLRGSRGDDDRQLRTVLRLKELQGDIEAFQTALGARELDYIQQRNLYQALTEQHEQLKAALLSSRAPENQDYCNDSPDDRRFLEEFVTPDSLEGEIYRIGLKLEEISDEISEQLHANDKGDPINQVLREDFENVKKSQSLGGTRSFSGEEQGVCADAIVEEVIRKDPRKSDDVFSGSDETDLVIHTPRHKNQQLFQSELDSSLYSHPYAKPNCVWEPGVEDLTESSHSPLQVAKQDEPKAKTSGLGSLYLARSPSLDTKGLGLWGKSSRTPSLSAKSTEESSACHSARKGFPSSRESVESVVYRGEKGKEKRAARPKDLDTCYGPKTRAKVSRGSGGSNKIGRSRCSSISQTHRSDSSFESSPPKLTSSPRKEAPNECKDLVHGRNQRYLHSRPGSETKASSEKSRTVVSPKDVIGRTRSRSFSGEQKVTDYEESSSSEKETSSEGDQRGRLLHHPKPEWPSSKNYMSKVQHGKDSKSEKKRLRPNTADSNVDSGFIGSEDSRRSHPLSSGFRNSLPNKPTPMTSSVQSPRRYSLDIGRNTLATPSRKSSGFAPSDFEDQTVPSIAYKSREKRGQQQQANQLFIDPSLKVASINTGSLSSNAASPRASKDSIPSPVAPNPLSHQPSFRDTETPEDIGQLSSSSDVSREVPSSTGELYRHRLERLREKTRPRPSSRNTIYTAQLNEGRFPTVLSTVEEAAYSQTKGSLANPPKMDRHNETQTRAADQESIQSDRFRRYSFELLRDEVQRLRAQLADESKMKDLHTQMMEDVRLRQAELDREKGWRAAEDRQKEMLNEIRRRLDKLSEQVKTPDTSYNKDSDLQDYHRLYNEVRGKIDNLAREIQRNKDRSYHATDINFSRHTALSPTPNLGIICPVCSGIGFHKHGNYVFPRDFLRSNSPVHMVPTQDIYSAPLTPEPAQMVTSTPVNHIPPQIKSPLPTYRIISKQPTSLCPSPNTIYHIHKHHKANEESSSSGESSGSEMESRRRKRRSPRRLKSSGRRWNGSELQEMRLHESLDEATKAAREMQRVSKKMLNTIASDLIQVGYDEY